MDLYNQGKTISQIRTITGCGFNSIKATIERHK